VIRVSLWHSKYICVKALQ